MIFRNFIPVLIYFLVYLFSFFPEEYYDSLVIVLLCTSLLSILDKLGRGVVLRESIAFMYVFNCLAMPLLGYRVYNYDYFWARLLKKYMPVSEKVYFDFTIPAVTLFCLALTFPFYKSQFIDQSIKFKEILEKCKRILSKDKFIGMFIIVAGLSSFMVSKLLPSSLSYLSIILYFSSFAGLLYVHFAPDFKNKRIIILAFILFLVLNSIVVGMFTVVAYMGVTIFSYFFLGKNIHLIKKVLVLLTAVFLLLILQNTKITYRDMVWYNSYQGDKTALFSRLFVENFQKGDALFEKKAFFPIHTRVNQGYNIALVMRRIPSAKPFDNGKAITTSIVSSFVPRLFWPDKPVAGGKFNMEYYTGRKIITWSTNIGPLGEAYGSFGVTGGIIYMFFLGLFIRWVYGRIFKISAKIPLIILWIPVLFYQVTYSAETDTLQIVNSILKTAFFMWILYKIFPRWFGMKKESQKPMVQLMTRPA